MYSIRLEGDTRRLLKKIRSFSELDKKALNKNLGEVVRNSTLERFKRSRGPDGKAWQQSTRAKDKGGKTLVQTAQLRNSIRTKSDASGFAVGTNVKHAATHQFGEKGRIIRAKRAKALRFQIDGDWFVKKKVKIKIPARPYLGLDDDDMAEIKAAIEDFLAKQEE